MQTLFNCGGQSLDLSRPRIMGILNVTPDSFADGGRYNTLDVQPTPFSTPLAINPAEQAIRCSFYPLGRTQQCH
jgi:dihydropteroate synthase